MKPVRSRCSLFILCGAAAIALGLLGCSASEYHIEVIARYPNSVALANLTITALPFNRGVLRDSLVEANEIPPPQFPDLETELATFTRPDISGLTESFLPWQSVHDSVRHLADSLNITGPDSSHQYARAFARLRDLYQRLAQSTVRRDAAIREQVGDDRELASRASAAADSLRAWERLTFARFPELADSALARAGRGVHSATTNNHGTAQFTLSPGRWWIVAAWVDP